MSISGEKGVLSFVIGNVDSFCHFQLFQIHFVEEKVAFGADSRLVAAK